MAALSRGGCRRRRGGGHVPGAPAGGLRALRDGGAAGRLHGRLRGPALFARRDGGPRLLPTGRVFCARESATRRALLGREMVLVGWHGWPLRVAQCLATAQVLCWP